MNLNNKIEWLDGGATWNPVTGCLHNCPYCFARNMARRFGGDYSYEWTEGNKSPLFMLDKPYYSKRSGNAEPRINPYPYSFAPTFHRYRLDEPQRVKKPQNIFVCSMADLFGDFIPDDWIQEVFDACKKAPQHRYLFLTKNPERYIELNKKNLLPAENNFWFGTSTVTQDSRYWWSKEHNFFVSIEPIMGEFTGPCTEVQENVVGAPLYLNWVIVGSESGNRKGKVIPKREWIENIVNECRRSKVPVFLKNSLREIWREPLIQEYPWRRNNDVH